MVKKERDLAKFSAPGFCEFDEKGRIYVPSQEGRIFISKNNLENDLPESLVITPNETGNSLWGMTEKMFEKWIRDLKKVNRLFLDLVYALRVRENFVCDSKSETKKENRISRCESSNEVRSFRLGPLKATQNFGLIRIPDKKLKQSGREREMLRVVCNVHEEHELDGYFLQLLPAVVGAEGAVFVDLRKRIKKVYPYYQFD